MTEPLLLCSDLDRTLLPNGTQQESPQARELLARIANRPEVVLVFVTGRDRSLVERAISCYQLPPPQFVISDVGSNIYDLRSGQWQLWQQWQDVIAPDWQGLSFIDISRMLSGIGALCQQEQSRQQHHKLSFYYPIGRDTTKMQQEISARLEKRQIRANLIWSADESANIGLLDILPRSASKLHALRYLREALDIPVSSTLFCGDSGNDLVVLASEIPSVLVANATDEVVAEAEAAVIAAGNQQTLYRARGNFLGMNGNYSAGIIEGLCHFHPRFLPMVSE